MKRNRRKATSSTRATATRSLRKKLSQAKVALDVATASAETIGHRTAMIRAAMTNPTGLANPEFATMSREKLVVAGEAATAMMRRMGGAHRIWTDYWFQQMQRACAALPELAGSRTPTRLMQVATVSAGTWMSDCMAFWMKATNFSENVADAAAKPIRRSVVANANRLANSA